MPQFHSLKVKNTTQNTPSSVTVSFDIPQELKNEFVFQAGQYITLKKTLNGSELRRAYSICSTSGSGELQIGIKKVTDGRFSSYANDELKEGDTLEVHSPEGAFTLKPNPSASRNIAAFAAGSGITPVMSIMKTLLEEEPNSNFVLVYGNKSVSETMFHNEIVALTEQYPDRLNVYFVYSQEQKENSLFGRIERSTVNYITKNKHKDQAFDTFYLCGPEEMIQTVSENLKENGIDEDRIKFELFTSSADEPAPAVSTEGATSIKVIVDDEEISFEMKKSDRILDAVLAEKIDAPYSCQGGICSSCIARVTEGKAEMVKNQILTDGEVAEGLILTCQSHAVTDSITIDYDDV
ncbi:2Fe-2S iron-sulfur cluster binding domain-containing protein [Leptobacterium flavescens]|uniref:2Fe-2S iron-sulfur cluster binding domain-containing protein n=1 Tax=Leptobacterium flavescens TaxID=472055 RepID=A0A6P0UIP5_9FLAO|nr:ferredoxin--NADP reductase [Leptobacterium flavescens]NER13231.1 2Fe-2S iron-sulfur cluster binding domain-containing protein [Leptobacterium flavescens]